MCSLTGFYDIQAWFRACSARNLFFKFYLASVLCAWLTRSSFSKCFLAFRMLIRVASEAASKTQKQCYSICSTEIHKWKIISSSPFHGTNRTHRRLPLCDSIHLTLPVCFTYNYYSLFNYKTGRSYSLHRKFEVDLWRVSLGSEP